MKRNKLISILSMLLVSQLLSSALFALPNRQLTSSPKFHWFGYYDKLAFDPTSRFVLGAEVGFQGRTPNSSDQLTLFRLDLNNGDQRKNIGTTVAWSWQQGCMLQYIPGSSNEVIYNDRSGSNFVARIVNTNNLSKRTINSSIYTLHPDGVTALTLDFERLHDVRPGYGYAGVADPNAGVNAPGNAGIYKVNLNSGSRSLIISLAELKNIPTSRDNINNRKLWVNHILINPNGKRFAFLNRWTNSSGKTETRMFTADMNGNNIHDISAGGAAWGFSHFIWKNDTQITSWAETSGGGKKFYVFNDTPSATRSSLGLTMWFNGHITYPTGDEWLLGDSYPDSNRKVRVGMTKISTNVRTELFNFTEPTSWVGEFRLDAHPRYSPNGKYVVFDKAAGSAGRQMHLFDVSSLTGQIELTHPGNYSAKSSNWATSGAGDFRHAFDGQAGTYAQGGTGDHWIEFDLGSAHTIKWARVYDDNAGNFSLGSWKVRYFDGSWKDAFGFTGTGNTGWNKVNFTDRSNVTKIRFYGRPPSGKTMEMYEFECFGLPSGGGSSSSSSSSSGGYLSEK